MSINIGDLVQCRGHGCKFGLVVDKRLPIDGLTTSHHVKHMLDTYQQVYYVYFSDEGKTGPYYSADLKVCHTVKLPESLKDES